MGQLRSFLNSCVTWEETGVRLDQQRHAEKVLCKHVRLVGIAQLCYGHAIQGCGEVRFRKLVGAMLYLAMHTRPNVAYAVGVLSQQCKQPNLAA